MDDMKNAFPELYRKPFKWSSRKSEVLKHRHRFGVEHDNVIAREVGCHPSTVGKYRKELGIEPKKPARRKTVKLSKRAEKAVKGLIEYSFEDIAGRFQDLTHRERKIVGDRKIMKEIVNWAGSKQEN